MKYLFTHKEIREAIHEVFSSDGEKWAIVGFVGYSALDQLPKGINNLSVICWPKAGATSPDGVRRLLKAGIKVYFCDQLHSKIYWSKDLGFVTGSANLSRNALGNSNQHEFAVHLSDNTLEINKILASLKYAAVNEHSLHKLDIAHVAALVRDPDCDKTTEDQIGFVEACQFPVPMKWKLVTWHGHREDNSHIKNAVYDGYGKSRWIEDNDVDDGLFEIGDFVLQVKVDENGLIERANCKWLRVEMVVKQSRKSPAIVQIEPLENGAMPPFSIDDGEFKKKFKSLFNSTTDWEDIIDKKSFVQKKFIRRLLELYR